MLRRKRKPSKGKKVGFLIFNNYFNLNNFRLHVTSDLQLLNTPEVQPLNGCIIGMGCIESSFFYQTVESIKCFDDPDLPALMLYLQYLIQTEVRIIIFSDVIVAGKRRNSRVLKRYEVLLNPYVSQT